MTYKGVVNSINEDSNEITFQFDDFSIVKAVSKYQNSPIGVSIHRWKEDRSIAQNNFLWACIGDICKTTQNHDKWQIYLEMLKRYGKFTHILVKPDAVEKFKREWREVEELGEVTTDKGEKAVQLRVYYGSHLYTTDEMKNLLDGVLDEMRILGIKPKLSKEEMERYGL